MFVDASAIVAILTNEPERHALLAILDEALSPVTSPLALFEAATAVARKKQQVIADSEMQVREFLRIARISIVPPTEQEGAVALSAFARFGKGQGHPAQLNMGDCFAYAGAKMRGLPLLFVGNDFAQTDILSAMA